MDQNKIENIENNDAILENLKESLIQHHQISTKAKKQMQMSQATNHMILKNWEDFREVWLSLQSFKVSKKNKIIAGKQRPTKTKSLSIIFHQR